ncbi:hypothetical protein FDUTEX481_04913 [Tolypothrix sp. PCC 7601]|nr:hypothetical protein FDUTEX481_04913 [Tolypothrix sp. PCC 7601]
MHEKNSCGMGILPVRGGQDVHPTRKIIATFKACHASRVCCRAAQRTKAQNTVRYHEV